MSSKVRTEGDEDVLVIVIDNPPINAGSLGVRRGLIEAIGELGSDPSLTAAVIIGSGATFIAGSDLREFGQPLEDPQLPAVIAAIEDCGKPVVAAIHGAALGGGFELSLGCDARVVDPAAVVGLPEVTLGMIPGAGGTQRVPRIVGVPRAIELICSGERVPAPRAFEQGLVDAVAKGDLRTAAVRHARSLAGRKRRLRDAAVPVSDDAAVERAAAAALRTGKRRPQVVAAIEAVKSAARVPIDAALAQERAVFQQLRLSRDAFALRHQFFAEREATKRPELHGISPRTVQHVAVIGGGTMGASISIAALDAGFQVTLLEQDAAALERGRKRIADHYAARVRAGKLKASAAAASEARLAPTTDW